MIIKQLKSDFNGLWQYLLFLDKCSIYIFEDRLGQVLRKHLSCMVLNNVRT